jgi:hypothetical protein
MRALRGFEGVREVTELSFTYGDAGAVISDVDFDEDWDLAGPGFFGDAVEEADVVWEMVFGPRMRATAASLGMDEGATGRP